MRLLAALLGIVLVGGCARSNKNVQIDEATDFAHIRRVGVTAFTDSKGRGELLADRVMDGLQKRLYEPVDRKVLEGILAKYHPDSRMGLGAEELQDIQVHTSADAILYGRVAGDDKAVLITLVETETGQAVLQAVLTPKSKKQPFTGPDEIVAEVLRVLTTPR